MRKYAAEFLGTFALVFFGCGSALVCGVNADSGCGMILTALAFGLSVFVMASALGHISGGHFNPAVSIAMRLEGKLGFKDLVLYVVAQLLGSTLATAALWFIRENGFGEYQAPFFAANTLFGVMNDIKTGLLVEMLLTFFFILTILMVTDEKNDTGRFAPLIIGLSLTMVHIVGIPMTGTSVNPARSFGPALISLICGEGEPMKQLWVFIAGPVAGALLAVFIHDLLTGRATMEATEGMMEP